MFIRCSYCEGRARYKMLFDKYMCTSCLLSAIIDGDDIEIIGAVKIEESKAYKILTNLEVK